MVKKCPLPIRKGLDCEDSCPFRMFWHDKQRGVKYLSCSYVHKQIADENGNTVEFEVGTPAVATDKTETE